MILRVGMEDADLPPVLRSLGRSLRLAYQAEPLLLVISFAFIVGAAVPEALGALWLKWLADGVAAADRSAVTAACAGLAAAAAAGWLMRTLGTRIEMRFRDRATIELEAHVARLQATVAGLEHHERPAYLDRLQLLRDQVFLLNHLYAALMTQVASIGRLAITIGLLMSVHPALALLAAFALPSVFVSSWRAGIERRVEEGSAPLLRRARHLFDVGTTAGPAKEVRVGTLAQRLRARRDAEWRAWYAARSRARWQSAAAHSGAWMLFGVAYVGAIVFAASVLRGSAGDVLLVLAAGANLSRYLGVTVGQAEFLRWTLDASQRLVWLEEYAARHGGRPDAAVPVALREGIRLDGASFRYPGTERWVLEDVHLELRAGSVIALVGENGAGKTTLVKLLCRFYEPTSGTIRVDGVDLARFAPDAWRARLAGAFQDFFRFEYPAQHSIGVGDLPRCDERPATLTAVERAGAADVIERLANGLDTQLGPTWQNGAELSIGQWQKVALARGFMRDRPLLCVLDEPTAALDAETEHGLFERFAAASRAARADGRITVLVSHRFSTVRMADLIVVLEGSRVAESGSHEELMARGGSYAELYETQARAYR